MDYNSGVSNPDDQTGNAASTDSEASSSSTPALLDDVLSPRKQPRLDFFAELRKRKEKGKFIKIKDLIPGRCVSQELMAIVTWKSRKLEKYLSFHVYDGNDFIVVKAFGAAKAHFLEIVEEFKVYKIKNFNVSSVDERFNHDFDGKFEIILSQNSTLQEVHETIKVPFNPVSLDNVSGLSSGAVIDVLGINVDSGEVRLSKVSGKNVREMSLIDKSEKTVSIFLWENDADNYKLPMHVPIGFRNVVVKPYGEGNTLWFQRTSTTDLRVDEDGKLLKWFKDETEGLLD